MKDVAIPLGAVGLAAGLVLILLGGALSMRAAVRTRTPSPSGLRLQAFGVGVAAIATGLAGGLLAYPLVPWLAIFVAAVVVLTGIGFLVLAARMRIRGGSNTHTDHSGDE